MEIPEHINKAFLWASRRTTLIDGVCVYYLWNAEGVLLYIGQSKDLKNRLYKHRSRMGFDSFSVIHCSVDNLSRLESEAIIHLAPIRNGHGGKSRSVGYVTEGDLVKYLHVSPEFLKAILIAIPMHPVATLGRSSVAYYSIHQVEDWQNNWYRAALTGTFFEGHPRWKVNGPLCQYPPKRQPLRLKS